MAGTLRLATASAEDTRSLGRAISGILEPGDVVSLTGDLGAGKTTLVQGAARGLGVEEPVLSPTFTLVREYRGSVPVYHLDVYRLERLHDVLDLGFEEIVELGGIVFVEWGDAIDALLPRAHLQVELTLPEDEAFRRISLSGRGEAWSRRWDRVEEACAPWAVG